MPSPGAGRPPGLAIRTFEWRRTDSFGRLRRRCRFDERVNPGLRRRPHRTSGVTRCTTHPPTRPAQRDPDRTELLDYCSRSANPVGRLLLHLYGVRDNASRVQSDAICSALQLINFWQDLSIDAPRNRLYMPLSDATAHGVEVQTLLDRRDSAEVRRLIASVTHWARTLMLQGAPLVHAVPGRAGWELRLVVQGGLRIADKIEAMDYATLLRRPHIGKGDAPALLWRALRMRRPVGSLTRETA